MSWRSKQRRKKHSEICERQAKARRFFCLARQTAKPFAGYAGCGALRAVLPASRPAASLGFARQTAKPFAGYAGCGALRAVLPASRPAASLGFARQTAKPFAGYAGRGALRLPATEGHLPVLRPRCRHVAKSIVFLPRCRTSIPKPDTGRRAATSRKAKGDEKSRPLAAISIT